MGANPEFFEILLEKSNPRPYWGALIKLGFNKLIIKPQISRKLTLEKYRRVFLSRGGPCAKKSCGDLKETDKNLCKFISTPKVERFLQILKIAVWEKNQRHSWKKYLCFNHSPAAVD